ncbi:MAG TPA: tyrosine-type recombinase/integrase [Thermoanaerobaculia bacterium]|nr:tyrosine-type recombinase/integrase [Thermoanaerobaculia bacterium]
MTTPRRDNGADNPARVYLDSLAPGSYWAVRHSLETVAGLLGGEGTDPWTYAWWKLRYRDTAAVRATLTQRFAPATANRMLSALRCVLKNAWRLGLMDHETYARAVDVQNVKAKTLPRGRAVEREDLRKLFGVCAADRSPAGRRDAAMLAVLYGGGLRRAELCGLDLADFDAASCTLTVRKGKGRQDRTVYLSPEVCGFLRAWTRERGDEVGPLFNPISGAGNVRLTRMRGETIWYLLRRRQEHAGLEGLSPHSLRRAYVTDLLDAGVDVFTVQRLAGHADAVTTARYDRRREQVQRQASARISLPST